MAKSRYEYVRDFEQMDCLLKNSWIVVRIDGRAFHKFTTDHDFTKPNDERALRLMNICAQAVMSEFHDIVIAYGESDEYSFVIDRKSIFYRRRESKLLSTIVSIFSSAYVFNWPSHFPNMPLQSLPVFDGRVVLYPTNDNVKDYLRWRQADCHVNNLYNTAFWALVQRGNRSTVEAENDLKGTLSSDKNELLFSKFGINYNSEPPMFRKGSILLRYEPRNGSMRLKKPVVIHDDLISESFYSDLYPAIIR